MNAALSNLRVALTGTGFRSTATLGEFLASNPDFTPEEIEAIGAALTEGQQYTIGGGAAPVFTLSLADRYYPKLRHVELIARQCSVSEWDRLCTSCDFLDAMSKSLEAMAAVATNFTGRKISATVSETKNESSNHENASF